MSTSQEEKAEALRRLHAGPRILVLPNAWDAVSACVIAGEGFPAIATSSSGCAAVLGYPDGQLIPRSEMVFLLGRIAKTVDLPVSVDVEAGYEDPVQTALDVIATGAVGLNLEDMAGGRLMPVSEHVARVRAVREVANSSGIPLVINARTDIFLAQHGDESTRVERSVERLNAYREAGADCLFAPGVRDAATIGRLVKAVKGPLNILSSVGSPSVSELQSMGVARVSFGGGPSRIALGAVRRFVRQLRADGSSEALSTEAIPFAEVEALLGRAR